MPTGKHSLHPQPCSRLFCGSSAGPTMMLSKDLSRQQGSPPSGGAGGLADFNALVDANELAHRTSLVQPRPLACFRLAQRPAFTDEGTIPVRAYRGTADQIEGCGWCPLAHALDLCGRWQALQGFPPSTSRAAPILPRQPRAVHSFPLRSGARVDKGLPGFMVPYDWQSRTYAYQRRNDQDRTSASGTRTSVARRVRTAWASAT